MTGYRSKGEDIKLPIIDEREYEVLLNWYFEWVKICKLLATFAFTAIGFTIILFNFNGETTLSDEILETVSQSWTRLAIGGALCGLSITFAYFWLDAFSRAHVPTLVGKAIHFRRARYFRHFGTIGWIVTIVALIFVVLGINKIIESAEMLLGI